MNTQASPCGINCAICDQYLDVCGGCPKEGICEALICVKGKNLKNCFECPRARYCKKRKRSVDSCLVSRPKMEIGKGAIHPIDWKQGMLTFVKYVFRGRKGILISPEPIGFALNGVDVFCLGEKSDLNPRNLDKIDNIVSEAIKNDKIILIDGLSLLINANSLNRVMELISSLNDKISSTESFLLLSLQGLNEKEKERIRGELIDSLIDNVMKSVSNPKRKKILHFLRKKGKSSFSEIYESLGYSPPPKLSFHLKILKDVRIVEQDEDGIYYLSGLGREVDKILTQMREKIQKLPRKAEISFSPEWREKLDQYLVDNKIKDLGDSLSIIFGDKKSLEILQTTLSYYVEAEKRMSNEDMKRIIAEIAFVFLADIVPLTEAIDWADEMLTKHALK
jgi:DNA-binding transcriptional ArsR family regulator